MNKDLLLKKKTSLNGEIEDVSQMKTLKSLG